MQHIYKLVNSINDSVYIGKSKNTRDRLNKHKSRLRSGKHFSKPLQELWDEHDGNIGIEAIIIETATEEECYRLEVFHQKLIPSHKLMNTRIVSCGGDQISKHPKNKEFRELQKELYKSNTNFIDSHEPKYGKDNPNYRHGKCIPNEQFCKVCGKKVFLLKEYCVSCVKLGSKNPFYGRQHSAETKAKLSKAHTGKKNDRDCKPFTINGCPYRSLVIASEATGIQYTTIRHRLISPNPKFSGYIYMTAEEREEYLKAERPSKATPSLDNNTCT